MELWCFRSVHAAVFDQIPDNLVYGSPLGSHCVVFNQRRNGSGRALLKVGVLFLLHAIHHSLDDVAGFLRNISQGNQRTRCCGQNAQVSQFPGVSCFVDGGFCSRAGLIQNLKSRDALGRGQALLQSLEFRPNHPFCISNGECVRTSLGISLNNHRQNRQFRSWDMCVVSKCTQKRVALSPGNMKITGNVTVPHRTLSFNNWANTIT